MIRLGIMHRVTIALDEEAWRKVKAAAVLAGEPVGVLEQDGQISLWYGARPLRVVPAGSLVKGRFN